MKNLILIAPPGGGKGTLSKQLVEKYGYIHISTGDLFREMAQRGDEFGNKIKEIMASGNLIDDKTVFEVLEKKLETVNSHYIIDGVPRNLEQAKEFDNILKKLNKDEGIVVEMQIDRELLKERITGRFSCSSCGQVYNIYNPEFAPKKEGICDKCGGSLTQRKDDNMEIFTVRYDTYLKNTQPLLDFYKEKGNLYSVDSSESAIAFEKVKELIK